MLKTEIKQIQRSTTNSKQSKMLLDMGNSGGEKKGLTRERKREGEGERRERKDAR
mgnify:CR=1 FL=1|jgi:hypothetical protein